MSSTTERERGQVLAIFAISLVALLGAGALAFDGGMMILERRDQQNAADAAAMAGARYVTTDHAKARTVAASVASDNGFTDGSGMQVVNVNVPPASRVSASSIAAASSLRTSTVKGDVPAPTTWSPTSILPSAGDPLATFVTFSVVFEIEPSSPVGPM